jgi:hypothetical protein
MSETPKNLYDAAPDLFSSVRKLVEQFLNGHGTTASPELMKEFMDALAKAEGDV